MGTGPAGGSATVPDPLTGRVLDRRYRIGERIARGGMAGVYEATDLRLDRTVAVKVMHPGLTGGLGSEGDFAMRFVREARSVARLSHPNVVAVFDQGEEDGVVFLVMEMVRGHTLRDTVAAHAPMTPARALTILEPVVAALAAAHREGLVHRDVKPENVLIAADGRIKVADFGLAKAVSAETQQTATGILIGTVSYIAPELVTEGRSDARADVYAVGVMLYELLTGAKPHAGETPIQVAYKHVHHDVPRPSRSVPGIPAYVDALVARATSRDCDQRPADAGVLLRQLHRVAHALAAGVTDDAELTSDLMPRPTVQPAPVVSEPTREHTRETSRDTSVERLPAPVGLAARDVGQLATRPPRGRVRRRRRGIVLLVLALLLAGGVGAGAWWFGVAQYTTTPGVIGMTRDGARDAMDSAGLELEATAASYSDTVPAGHVISTDPAPGDRIHDGDTVSAVFSRGVEEYRLPRLAGLTLDQAQDRILGVKMDAGRVVRQFSEKVPAGRVISSKPAVGEVLRPGTVVRLLVSRGRHPITVETVVGRPQDDAEVALEGRGLVTTISGYEYSRTVAAGDVISQDPSTGRLYRGDTVRLVVSRGPELVEMPKLVAVGVDEATEQLEDLGLVVEVADSPSYIGLGYVLTTDPPAGSQVPVGDTVTIYLV